MGPDVDFLCQCSLGKRRGGGPYEIVGLGKSVVSQRARYGAACIFARCPLVIRTERDIAGELSVNRKARESSPP
ncbi:hypothetical protein EVAR_19688_1 [Eumeta japonica]|uniref:Uncharacterized protein n=1 Tax=Eumeta variegata TaxID=151549 RepID=A0A4C1V3B1_EUMVA|nr:hypothetical protein EVAR_19688_1 [Eumeta japonica]